MNEGLLIALLLATFVLAMGLALYPLRKLPLPGLFFSLLMALMVGLAYWHWGSFAQWRQYLHQDEQRKQAEKMMQALKSPEELVGKLKAKLNEHPESAKGWYLLGRLYDAQGQWQQAAAAYGKAHQLVPEDTPYAVYYAQGLWRLNQQQFTAEIRQIFNDILSREPEQPDALAMLAVDAFSRQDYEAAIGYWQHLLKLAPVQSEEAAALRKAIAHAQQQLRISE